MRSRRTKDLGRDIMIAAIACRAIREGRRMELLYHGHRRIVEVHRVATTIAGEHVVNVFQIAGGSQGGSPFGWRTLRLDEIEEGCLTEQKSHAPRPGYDPAAGRYRRVICKVEEAGVKRTA